MKRVFLVAIAGLLFAPIASASGYRPPAHSELAYSFTCPSGASGHLRYVVDFVSEFTPKLTMWVNGQYIASDPTVSAGLHGKNIEQLQASCEGDNTLVLLKTFDPDTSEQAVFAISVDRSGKVTSAGAGA